MKKILFSVIAVMIFSATNAQTQQQKPVAIFKNLPPIGGWERGNMYLDEPPSRGFNNRTAPGHLWTIGADGNLLKHDIVVEIINPVGDWDATFVKGVSYPKRVVGAVEVNQRVNNEGQPLVDKNGNPLVTYRVTM